MAAALPGGDPLAAALAAGETPSPEMVAAAGEGDGLSLKIAIPLLIAVLAGMAVSAVLSNRASTLQRLRPEYGPEVLAQKARDMVRSLGVTTAPADEDGDFGWDGPYLDHARKSHQPRPDWDAILAHQPSVLHFQYRRADSAMTVRCFMTISSRRAW